MSANQVPGAHAVVFNRFTNVSPSDPDLKDQMEKLKRGEKHVPNTHGGAPFVVKVQLNSHPARGSSGPTLHERAKIADPSMDGKTMLIYDRQRTLRVIALAGAGEPGSFNDVANLVKERGYQSLKVFCWAIRSGESTIDVCIDRLPEWENW